MICVLNTIDGFTKLLEWKEESSIPPILSIVISDRSSFLEFKRENFCKVAKMQFRKVMEKDGFHYYQEMTS